ncbi:MAG TPA: TCR/Tet family MFS transporter [Caulobacteraceae bacterium]|jgi:DHA1 family tetracycline resistance protein-like MFS transporter
MADVGPPRRQAALGFIFMAVVLDVLALGITAPVLPSLIKQLINGDAAQAARYVGWFAAIWAVMQLVASPIIGALSDRFGRRPVLLASMFGQAADYVVMALAPTVGWLLIGRIFSGVTASSFSTANAYIADITPPEKRAARFGVLSAAFGIGFIAGPAIGGLLGQIDPRAPFWGAGAVCLLNGLYGLFLVPESLKAEHRAKFSVKLANPVGSFDLYAARPGLLALACIYFIYYLAHQVLQSTWVPYASYRYQWPAWIMGVSFVVVGAGSIAVQAGLVKPFVARFGERGALAAGLFAGTLGFGLFGLAPRGWMFLAAIPVFSCMGLVGPGIQGLMSRQVGPTEQGRLGGANTGVMAIASMIGPIFFTEIFARSIGRWAPWAPVGLAFYAACALLAGALILALAVQRRAAPAAAPG